MPTEVAAIPAAPPALAEAHFAAEFSFETDCWDVHDGLQRGADFVLLDVRSPALFAAGHVPGAINLPHAKLVESKLAAWPADTLFITDCAGPHCNGAARGALRLARLKRPVKVMAGGITGWQDEGFTLATELQDRAPMSHVLIIHAVKDYPAWKKIFDSAAGLRKAAGEQSYFVLRDENDANRIVHFSQWLSLDDARAFFESPRLVQIRLDAGVEAPEFNYLHSLEQGVL